jgi:hypothetical protein
LLTTAVADDGGRRGLARSGALLAPGPGVSLSAPVCLLGFAATRGSLAKTTIGKFIGFKRQMSDFFRFSAKICLLASGQVVL